MSEIEFGIEKADKQREDEKESWDGSSLYRSTSNRAGPPFVLTVARVPVNCGMFRQGWLAHRSAIVKSLNDL